MSIYTASHSPISGGGVLLNLTATASTSPVLSGLTRGVYLTATVPCLVELALGATASANTGLYLAASVTYWFDAAASAQISGIRVGGADGSLYIKPTYD